MICLSALLSARTMFKLVWLSVLLCVLAWYLNSCIVPRKPPIVNDDFSFFFDPQKIKLPEMESAIVQIVQNASMTGKQVRVVGSGHSRNALAWSRDLIVSLERFKGVVNLDSRSQQVTVRAGTTLYEMVTYLDEQGLALGVLPAILEQTVAGAISTGTHGCRTGYGNLATLVTKLRIVTGNGSILTVSAHDDNTDLFRASLVSLGLLGIITEITFQCEPAFNLEETMEKHTLESCLTDLSNIATSAEHTKLWVELYSSSCDVYRFKRTEKKPQMNTLLWRNLKMHIWEPVLYLSSWMSSLAPHLIRNSVIYGGVFQSDYTQVGKSFEILTYPFYVPQNKQVEFSVDISDCASALRAIKVQMEFWKPASVFLEVRFVAPDDIWLSMNYKRQSCHITVIIYNPSAALKNSFFSSLYEAIHSLGAKPRPHFGKYFNLTVEEMADLYPKFMDFKQVRMRLDPSARFVNSMLAELFLF